MNINLNKKRIILIVLIILMIILLVILISSLKNRNANNSELENIDVNKEFDDTNLDKEDSDIIEEELSSEIYPVQNPGLAFETYWAINRLKVSAYSADAMLKILDDEYLNYYNLNETNISEKIESYKGKEYNIVDIKYAYYDSTYLCIATCADGKQFIFKYSEYYKGYTLFLDDYIQDIGYDNFVNNKVKEILTSSFKGSEYTVLDSITYTDNVILKNYAALIGDVDNLYYNIIDEDTKSRYTYENLEEIYNDDYSLFGMNFSKVNFSKEINEKGFFTYKFKDLSGRNYILTEDSYFKFSLNIN